ncbi:hypothetical protein TUM4261_40380 [Shewanella sp. c952]|nr:hypothetical protein TUM4261_40380 [Shewanella sp. c952]
MDETCEHCSRTYRLNRDRVKVYSVPDGVHLFKALYDNNYCRWGNEDKAPLYRAYLLLIKL